MHKSTKGKFLRRKSGTENNRCRNKAAAQKDLLEELPFEDDDANNIENPSRHEAVGGRRRQASPVPERNANEPDLVRREERPEERPEERMVQAVEEHPQGASALVGLNAALQRRPLPLGPSRVTLANALPEAVRASYKYILKCFTRGEVYFKIMCSHSEPFKVEIRMWDAYDCNCALMLFSPSSKPPPAFPKFNTVTKDRIFKDINTHIKNRLQFQKLQDKRRCRDRQESRKTKGINFSIVNDVD